MLGEPKATALLSKPASTCEAAAVLSAPTSEATVVMPTPALTSDGLLEWVRAAEARLHLLESLLALLWSISFSIKLMNTRGLGKSDGLSLGSVFVPMLHSSREGELLDQRQRGQTKAAGSSWQEGEVNEGDGVLTPAKEVREVVEKVLRAPGRGASASLCGSSLFTTKDTVAITLSPSCTLRALVN